VPCSEWSNNPDIAEWMTGYREGGEFLSYHPEAKAKLVEYSENIYEIVDSLGICKLTYGHTPLWHDRGEDMGKLYQHLIKGLAYATGIEYTKEDLFKIGEKAYQIERATIALRGIRRKDDMPNWRILNESCPGEHPVNPVPLPPIDKKKYEKILDTYYELRGWTGEGIPTPERLRGLGLESVAQAIEKGGVLSEKKGKGKKKTK
jgi:aldehyde:ferredoxin oxidoreductase